MWYDAEKNILQRQVLVVGGEALQYTFHMCEHCTGRGFTEYMK